MDDSTVLNKISEGDEQAFQYFVEKYHKMVINICYNIVNSHDDAMDISQDVFIKIYESINQFRGESKISTWLYRISVNKSLNFLRSKKRQKWFSGLDVLFDNGERKIDPVDDSLDASENLEQNENKKALYYALHQLPEKQNIAITLNHFEDLSYKEIAEIMDVSVSEVGVLINRGKKRLEKLIINYFNKN